MDIQELWARADLLCPSSSSCQEDRSVLQRLCCWGNRSTRGWRFSCGKCLLNLFCFPKASLKWGIFHLLGVRRRLPRCSSSLLMFSLVCVLLLFTLLPRVCAFLLFSFLFPLGCRGQHSCISVHKLLHFKDNTVAYEPPSLWARLFFLTRPPVTNQHLLIPQMPVCFSCFSISCFLFPVSSRANTHRYGPLFLPLVAAVAPRARVLLLHTHTPAARSLGQPWTATQLLNYLTVKSV